MNGARAVTLFPPKAPKPKKKGRSPLIAYRSPREQHQYIEGLVERGYTLPKVMTRIVGTARHLDERLQPVAERLRAFAEAEGIILMETSEPSDVPPPIAEAMVRAIMLGLDAYDRERKSKK